MEPNNQQKVSFKKFLALFKPYSWYLGILLLMTLLVSGSNLIIPKIVASTIDSYTQGTFNQTNTILLFGGVVLVIFLLSVVQSILQIRLSEGVARDLRKKIAQRISFFTYRQVMDQTPSRLLTNFTSDVDSIKNFIAQGLVLLISSLLLIIGSVILLLNTNVKLALIVFAILPLILIAFFAIFKNVGQLFGKAQAVTDTLNRVISETIFGSALIRVLFAQYEEVIKFKSVNSDAKEIGTSILKLFAALIPIITTVANLCVLAVIFFGGRSVISGELSLGEFVAFYNYISLLIFPIIVLGFISSEFGRAITSFQRIEELNTIQEELDTGTHQGSLSGSIEFKNVSYTINNQSILRSISFNIAAGKKTAIVGPTAAGKTQIFYLIANLIKQNSGTITYNGVESHLYDKDFFYKQIGLVFQDSIIFNTSLRENIAFRDDISEEAVTRAIETAELQDFIKGLPNGLDTIISERGTSLSGGQKQRIMLARALAHQPTVLLLDDFTARVDNDTENRIFANLEKNYPDITKILITQKVSSILDADQIILLMEGELLATGTHEELLQSSFEYQQIVQSQKTTE